MIDARKRHPQLALGSYTTVPVTNPAMLAYLRGPCEGGAETILCVANLSRAGPAGGGPAAATTTGGCPSSCSGRVEFPRIGELPYLLTLPPHGFFWFELR